MKIILTAFNRKLKSEPFEISDSQGDVFYLSPLPNMDYNICKSFNKPSNGSVVKELKFRRTRYFFTFSELSKTFKIDKKFKKQPFWEYEYEK